ncbi:MAG: CapA family protein [Treponema sp.]|nr:CapA family protein [Treponema sp.]
MSEKTKKTSKKNKTSESSGVNSSKKSNNAKNSDNKKSKNSAKKNGSKLKGKIQAVCKKIKKWIKPPVIKANIIISFAIIILITLCIIFFRHAFRPVSYIVRVNDKLYEQYFKNAPLPQKELNISFVKTSDKDADKETFFGPVIKNAGTIQPHQEIALLPQEYEANQKFFIISQNSFLPTVPADFSSKGDSVSINSPELNLTFVIPENLPQGNRALPVEKLYSDDPSYKLIFKTGVLCTITEEIILQPAFDYCEKIFPSPEVKSSAEVVTIASVGDIMVARGVQEILIDNENGLEKVFGDTLPILQNADFTIGNLEGVVTESWKNATKTYTFKFKKEVLPKIMEAGFDYLMQTNNHCYDYGEDGFKDTLAAFEEYNIPSSGIGKNIEEAKKFYHTTIKGLPVAVISCGAFPVERSGFNGEKTATATEERAGILWKNDELFTQIKAEKKAGYFVIVNVHGGEEYNFSPTKKQREFYQRLCDNGADVVFGSHPHVLQPTEWHGNSLIVFSMGNFIFNGMEGMRGGTDSEIVKLGILNGRIAYVEQYPASIIKNGVKLK